MGVFFSEDLKQKGMKYINYKLQWLHFYNLRFNSFNATLNNSMAPGEERKYYNFKFALIDEGEKLHNSFYSISNFAYYKCSIYDHYFKNPNLKS